jgi:interferon-induced GTP-binding protein Mx1
MSLNSSFGTDVRPWLKLAEDLRTLNLEGELKVPQICVMGDQSSGLVSWLWNECLWLHVNDYFF